MSCHTHDTSHHDLHKHGEKSTHSAHNHSAMLKDFTIRFWVSLIFTIPIILLSLSFTDFAFTNESKLDLLLLLSSVVFFYGGFPFLKGAIMEIKSRSLGMMTLIALAIVTAYLYSVFVVFVIIGNPLFWEVATLIDIMLLGHFLEMKAVLGASRSLELLVKMLPSSTFLIKGGEIVEVKIEELQTGDTVLVKSGSSIPVDGVIVEGFGYLNESMLTGESTPVKKGFGDKVIGGSINGDTAIKVKVVATGEKTYLAKMIALVARAQKEKSKTQLLADKAANWLTIIALLTGGITLFSWLTVGEKFSFSVERMVAVLVICCPHALGLAIPLVVAISTTICAKGGLLIRNRTAFENARKITTVVFDKTGTLTKGSFDLNKFSSLAREYSDEKILILAASIEKYSEHPIAKGILKKLKELNLEEMPAKNVSNLPGEGIRGELEGRVVQIVSPAYLQKNSIEVTPYPVFSLAETVVFLLLNQRAIGYLTLRDEIREESFEAVQKLKKEGIKTVMITGDNEEVAKAVSEELKLDGYFANILPHKKLEIVKELQQKGEFVAMTGDGINDAPALAAADVGIAVGAGTDIAAETADIILVESNPRDILKLILFGKATYNKMVQNLFWATSYNIIAIPLAAGILYKYGVVLNPAFGAILMSLSTIIVAFNAKLLEIGNNQIKKQGV